MTLQEIANKKNKRLFIESYTIDTTLLQKNVEVLRVPIKESLNITNELKESIELKEYNELSCFAIVRSIPISKYDENGNGRIYPEKLWKRIYEGGYANGTLCLADHPNENESGSFTRVLGVWHNPHFINNLPHADLHLVEGGHGYGPLFLNTVKAGGKVGVSTVGFGEFENDGKTVKWDTYELCRLADAVLDPSQGVFATQENLKENKEIIKEEKEKDVNIETSDTNLNKDKNMAIDKIQESNFRNQIRVALKEAKGTDNLHQAQTDLRQVLSLVPEELSDLREQVQKEIDSIDTKLALQLKESEKSIETISKEKTDLSVKYESACETIKELTEKLNKHKAILTELGASEEDPEKLLKVESMLNDIKQFSTDRELMENDMKQLIKDRQVMKEDLKKAKEIVKENKELKEQITAMQKDLNQFATDRELMEADMSKLLEDRKKMKLDLKEYARKINEEGAAYGDIENEEDEEVNAPNQSISVDPAMDVKLENKKNSAILNFYKEEVKKYPALKVMKEKILKAKSLVEAVRVVDSFKSKSSDKVISLKESMYAESDKYEYVY